MHNQPEADVAVLADVDCGPATEPEPESEEHAAAPQNPRHGDMTGAEQWLQEFLANGSQPAKEVVARARECGFSTMTLRRAKAALGVRTDRHGFNKGESHFTWSLRDRIADGAIENVSTYEKY